MEWLRFEAKARGVSISQLIRESINFYRTHAERIPKDQKRKALEVVGRFSSKDSDVSGRHDDYLAEAYATEDRDGD